MFYILKGLRYKSPSFLLFSVRMSNGNNASRTWHLTSFPYKNLVFSIYHEMKTLASRFNTDGKNLFYKNLNPAHLHVKLLRILTFRAHLFPPKHTSQLSTDRLPFISVQSELHCKYLMRYLYCPEFSWWKAAFSHYSALPSVGSLEMVHLMLISKDDKSSKPFPLLFLVAKYTK